MTDAVTTMLERTIRDATYDHCRTDPPAVELRAWLMCQLDRNRDRIPRVDALRLEALIDALTGHTRWTGMD